MRGRGAGGRSGSRRAVAIRAGRGGFTLFEALVALLLLGGLLQLCWAVAAVQRRAAARIGERSDVLEAERTVWWVLSTETSAGVAGRDWRVGTPGILSLRAFRGRGLACTSVDPDGWVDVRYRGWRLPDPDKDSVLVLDVEGRWSARDLAGRSAGEGACASHPAGERWRLEPVPSDGVVLARVFERGSYHLEDPSFRYRRGAGGRQPLTGGVLDPEGSGISATGEGFAVVRFRGAPGRRSAPASLPDSGWTRTLRGG